MSYITITKTIKKYNIIIKQYQNLNIIQSAQSKYTNIYQISTKARNHCNECIEGLPYPYYDPYWPVLKTSSIWIRDPSGRRQLISAKGCAYAVAWIIKSFSGESHIVADFGWWSVIIFDVISMFCYCHWSVFYLILCLFWWNFVFLCLIFKAIFNFYFFIDYVTIYKKYSRIIIICSICFKQTANIKVIDKILIVVK